MSFLDKKSFSVKDHSVSQGDFELRYDDTYDMWNTFPKPDEKNLKAYYESAAYISHTDATSSLIDKLYQQVKKWMLAYKFKIIEPYQSAGHLLDLGAGTGDFLMEAKSKNWQISGVEPNPKARVLAQKKGIHLECDLLEITGTFEVITMWHVLEHVHNLSKYLHFLKDHLSENGVLLIAVPNFKSRDAVKYGKFWAANDVPRHLYHFSKTAIEKLFAEVGLELVETKPLVFDSFYVSHLSEKYKGNNFTLLRGIISGLYSNLSATHSKEYSSQIYLLKHRKTNLKDAKHVYKIKPNTI